MNQIRVAIIGCGSIAKKHISALLELGTKVIVQALCDIDERRLERFSNEICRAHYPDVELYTSLDLLLEKDHSDLIVITSSSDSHARLALKALQSGRHVLVEKPLALAIEEAKEVVESAKRAGRILAVSFQARYLPQMKLIKEAVEEGRFGQLGHGVVSMRLNRNPDYFKESPWRETWAQGGGLFINQCIHYIDLLQWFMGPVDTVYARAGTFGQQLGVENTGAVVMQFHSGAIGIVEASTAIYPCSLGTSISLFGGSGSVSIEGERLNEVKHWRFDQETEGEHFTPHQAGSLSYQPLYLDLIHAIGTGEAPLVAGDSTLRALEIVLAVYQSIAIGKVVQLPLQGFDLGKMALPGDVK